MDSKLKPWLLEVNHTPSFNIDTSLDQRVKRNLISDVFNLLDISLENRKKHFELLKRSLKTGLEKKKRFSFDDRMNAWEQAQIERDFYEENHLGNFTKLSSKNEEKYENYRKFSADSWEEMTGTSKLFFSFCKIKKMFIFQKLRLIHKKCCKPKEKKKKKR